MVHTKSFLIPLFNSLLRPPIIFYFFMKTHGININNNNNNHNNNNNNNNHFTIVITIKILLKMLYHFFQKCNESFFSTESGTSSSQSKLFAIWTRPREQYIMIISYDNIICTPCMHIHHFNPYIGHFNLLIATLFVISLLFSFPQNLEPHHPNPNCLPSEPGLKSNILWLCPIII